MQVRLSGRFGSVLARFGHLHAGHAQLGSLDSPQIDSSRILLQELVRVGDQNLGTALTVLTDYTHARLGPLYAWLWLPAPLPQFRDSFVILRYGQAL